MITFDNVTFAYGNQNILENVSFQVQEKEFIGIFGPNGGGKTTLLKLIMGFLKPTKGTIEVMGVSPKEAQEKIAYVPQTLKCDRQFPISVFELVLSGRLFNLPWHGRYSSADKEMAHAIIEKMRLGNVKDRSFGILSGGQAQRTLIARALISDPKLLLLDEPTASVDSESENEIYEILEELRGNITIFMVTHHLRTVIDQVERVFCVNKNVVDLKPEEVCEHFAIGLYHPPLKGGH